MLLYLGKTQNDVILPERWRWLRHSVCVVITATSVSNYLAHFLNVIRQMFSLSRLIHPELTSEISIGLWRESNDVLLASYNFGVEALRKPAKQKHVVSLVDRMEASPALKRQFPADLKSPELTQKSLDEKEAGMLSVKVRALTLWSFKSHANTFTLGTFFQFQYLDIPTDKSSERALTANTPVDKKVKSRQIISQGGRSFVSNTVSVYYQPLSEKGKIEEDHHNS